LKITTFGTFSIQSENGILDLSKLKSRKARDLLRYFVAFRHKQIPTDILCDLFWQDMDEKYAKMNLQSTIHMLRAFLGKELIVFQNGNYCFDPAATVECDSDVFETLIRSARASGDPSQKKKDLEDAIALYKGDFLIEDLYQDWAIQFRETYKDLSVQALIELAQILIEENSTTRAVEVLKIALNSDPFEEAAALNLMKAYIKKGCPSEAIKVYRKFAQVLADELQIKPSRELTQLCETIMRGELADRWLIIVEGQSCSSSRELVIQQLKRLIRENDEVQVLSGDKLGILISDVSESTATTIYQRIKDSLNNSVGEVKIHLRKAR